MHTFLYLLVETKKIILIFEAISIAVAILLILIFIWKIIWKKKKISVGSIALGPVGLVANDVEINKIKILSSPMGACKNDILTPALKVEITDINGKFLKDQKVRLEIIYDDYRVVNFNKITGKTVKITNEKGIAIFDDLKFKNTGNYIIKIECGKKSISTDMFEIFPPGIEIDYWNYSIGSEEYEDRLDRALAFSQKE